MFPIESEKRTNRHASRSRWSLLGLALCGAITLTAVSSTALAAPMPEQPVVEKKSDATKLIGKWTVVTVEEDGQKHPQDWKWEFDGAFLTETVPDFAPKKFANWSMRYTIDAAKSPSQIDLAMEVTFEGRTEIYTEKFLYEFDGDTLRIAIGKNREVRPESFSSKSVKKIVTLKRVGENR